MILGGPGKGGNGGGNGPTTTEGPTTTAVIVRKPYASSFCFLGLFFKSFKKGRFVK